MRVLAYDHGSKAAGWGVIEFTGRQPRLVDHGAFEYETWPRTLADAYSDLAGLLSTYRPATVLFYNQASMRNAKTARRLLQVQGSVMLACVEAGIPYVDEIRDVTVKRIVGGSGKATKAQVKAQVRAALGITAKITEDTSDALGLALAYPVWQIEQEAKTDGTRGCKPARSPGRDRGSKPDGRRVGA